MPDDQRQAYFDAVAAITPVRRVGRPEDVANAIAYLAGAGFITGTVLECTGGSNLTAGRSLADHAVDLGSLTEVGETRCRSG